jgi:TP901 family phage tail tape measure protein
LAAELVASLVLKLEDQLGGGLRKLTETLDKMRDVANGVNLNALKNAGGMVDGLRAKLSETTGVLSRMGAVAGEVGRAFVAMGRAAGAGINDIKNKAHNFGEAGSNLINKGFGAAAEGFAVYEPIKQYAERDTELRSIGIMEHLSGPALDAEIQRLNKLVNTDALKHGLSGANVAEAYKDLLGQGLPRAQIDSIISAHSAAAKAYGIPPELLGPVTGALVGNLKIPSNEADAGGALAAIAAASQTGRFKMADFARELPGLTGVSASLGMTGRGSLNELAAALEISTKTASDPAQAGVNLHDLLAYITSNREDNLSRKKLGLDMPALLLKGEKEGKNPLDVYLAEIMKLTAGKSPVAQAQAISSIVTNQQPRNALLALVQHNDEFRDLQRTLGGINAEKLRLDEASASGGAQTGLDKMAENIHQIMLTLGQGFAPTLDLVNTALGWINEKLTYLNTNFPKTTGYVLSGVAGFLALGAAITLIGAIVPVFVAGFQLIGSVLGFVLSPLKYIWTAVSMLVEVLAGLLGLSSGVIIGIAVLAAAIVAAGVAIYEHWGHLGEFFGGLWRDIEAGGARFVAWVDSWSGGSATAAIRGVETGWSGLARAFALQWDLAKTVFKTFGTWVDGWSGGLASRILAGIASGWGGLVSGVHGLVGRLSSTFDNSRLGRLLGLADKASQSGSGAAPGAPSPLAAAAAGAPGASGTVNLRIQADPGTRVTAASATPGINVQAPARGATLARP